MVVKYMNYYERLRLCRVNTRRAYKNFQKRKRFFFSLRRREKLGRWAGLGWVEKSS